MFQNHFCEEELHRMKNCYVNITKLDIDVANYGFHNKQESDILTTSDNVNNSLEPIYNTETNYLSQSQLPTYGSNDSSNNRYKATYKCELCGYLFFNQDSYKKHYKKHASNKILNAPSITDVLPTVSNDDVYKKHYKKHTSATNAKKDLQNKNFGMFKYRNKFDESHCSKKTEGKYKCGHCGCLFFNPEAYMKHYKKHASNKILNAPSITDVLPTVSKIFTDKDQVSTLDETNAKKDYFDIWKYWYAFDKNYDPIEGKFKCEFCGYSCFNDNRFKKHYKKHTSNKILNAASTADLLPTSARMDLQNKNFGILNKYWNKWAESLCSEKNESKYKCEYCECLFFNQDAYKKHYKKHVSNKILNAPSIADLLPTVSKIFTDKDQVSTLDEANNTKQDFMSQAEPVSSHVPNDLQNINLDIEPHLKIFYCECIDAHSSNPVEKSCLVCLTKYSKVCEFYRKFRNEHQQAAAGNATPDVSGYLDNLDVSNAATTSSNVILIKSKQLIHPDIVSAYTHAKYLQFLKSLVNLKTNFPPESNISELSEEFLDLTNWNLDGMFSLPISMLDEMIMSIDCLCPMDQCESEDERDLMAFKRSIHFREGDHSLDDIQTNRQNRFVWKLNCPFYKVMAVLVKLEPCDMCVHIFSNLFEIRVTWQIVYFTKYSAFMCPTLKNFLCGLCLTVVPLSSMLNHFISSHDERILNINIGAYKDVME